MSYQTSPKQTFTPAVMFQSKYQVTVTSSLAFMDQIQLSCISYFGGTWLLVNNNLR